MIGPTPGYRALFDFMAWKKVRLLASRLLYFAICLCGMPEGVAAQNPQKEYAQEYRQPFKGPPENPKDFALVGPDAQEYVKFEPEGLRITLPPGHPKERKGTGVATGFAVRGDFEITLSFEVFKEPVPEDAGPKTRLTLATNLDRPSPWLNQTALTRRVTLRNGTQNVTWMSLWDDTARKSVPTSAAFTTVEKRGRFRLVRVGADVSYYVAEGADGELKFLATYNYSAEDVRDIAIVASTGGEKAEFDVRITDLHIRAASFPKTPPERKTVVVADAKPPEPAADPKQFVPASREETKGYLFAGLLIGLAIILFLFLTIGVWLYVRKGGAVNKVPADAALAAISFPCPECERTLKTKPEMAGKRLKCTHCGAAALVPALTR